MLTIQATAETMLASRTGEDELRIEVLSGLAQAERAWRSFEAGAVLSPYQRFDWSAAFAAATGAEDAVRTALVRDGTGRTVALLPFVLSHRYGLRIASAIGDKHANFNLPPMRAGFGAGADRNALATLFRRIGTEIGADAISVDHVPTRWAGEPVPLALLGLPSANTAREVRLDADPEATALRSMSNEARKRLRNKERGLAKSGVVTFARAETEAGIEEALDVFFRQKEVRFAQLGIADPFLDLGIREFIRHASLAQLASGSPAIELYVLRVGSEIVSVLGGAADGQRLSGMFISFEDREEVTKYSPGDILVSRIVRDQCTRGRSYFDLGTGEARYKRTFCDEEVALVDILLPITWRGQLFVAARAAAIAAKRRVKESERAMTAVRLIRRARALVPKRAG